MPVKRFISDCFDPFATYAIHTDGQIYSARDKPWTFSRAAASDSSASRAIWLVGLDAIALLSNWDDEALVSKVNPELTEEVFWNVVEHYRKFAEEMRQVLAERVRKGGMTLLGPTREKLEIPFVLSCLQEGDDPYIIEKAWAFTSWAPKDDEQMTLFAEAMLIASIESVGGALFEISVNPEYAVESALEAAQFLHRAKQIIGSKRVKDSEKRKRAIANADKRHKENRDLKKTALEHYASHKDDYKSFEAAAKHISTVLIPVTQRTVVTWIRKSKKNTVS